jgi:hypothetical protein
VHSVCSAAALQGCFKNEGALERRIQATGLFSFDGPVQVDLEKLPDPDFAQALIEFYRTVYECRKKLIDKYIGEFNYSPGLYYERLFELPVPPILFYPDVSAQGGVMGVHEKEFQIRGNPLYKIAAYPQRGAFGGHCFCGFDKSSGYGARG